MAKKKAETEKLDKGEPKFPYTTEPKALRRLLAVIPNKPKPPKLNMSMIKSWDVSKNNNARTAINVLRKIGLVSDSGEPTSHYVDYMKTGSGPVALGLRIRETYKVLFESSHTPYKESEEELKKLFNINSGGGSDAMRLQIQTFKALADYAKFDGAGVVVNNLGGAAGQSDESGNDGNGNNSNLPPIRVDLHIHLPESKTTRDYQAIIQDIAKYIYGRDINET